MISLKALPIRLATLALLASLPVTLVACGDNDDDGGAATTPSAQTTTPATEGSPTAGATAAFPVTVTDMLGRETEIAEEPVNIVAISPTTVEYVYSVGAEVVGRVESAEFPEAVLDVETVGSAYQPNFEAILALDPDLIVADSLIHAQPQLRSGIEGLGVPVVFVGAGSYQDVIDGLGIIGAALGRPDEAAAKVEEIEGQLAEAQGMVEGADVSAIVLIGDRDGVLYAANSGGYPGDLMNLLGIENAFADQSDAGPFPGYSTAAPELLLQANPDYIFVISPAPAPAPPLSTVLPSIPGLNQLEAISSGKVVELDPALFIQASGPRVGDALLQMAEVVAN